MSATSLYYVTFFDTSFNSLEDAKWNVKIAFSCKEAKKFLAHAHEYIYHYLGKRMVSQTPINVDEVGNISFGRTRKITY